MTCVTDGILRAKIDGELSEAELLEVEKHLTACADCRNRADVIARQAERVRGVLSRLTPLPGEVRTDARIAFAHFQARQTTAEREVPSFLSRLFSRRLAPAWGAVALALIVVASLSFAPARSWGQRILAMLRVEKITVVPIDMETLDKANADGRAGRSMAKLFSDEVIVTMKPGEPQPVSDPEQATEVAGFKIRLLSSRTDTPRIKVVGEQAFHMTINRDRLQAILDEAGRSDLQLSADVDGATVAVHIPKIVMAEYGNCPHAPDDNNTYPQGGGETNCIDLAQAPSPTVSVPPNLNMAQLAELGLQLGGMSAQDAHAFSQTIDWTSTLVIGIPRGISYQTVEVDGVQGTLIEMARRDKKPRNSLLWVKNGIVYCLTASGTSADALAVAESLN